MPNRNLHRYILLAACGLALLSACARAPAPAAAVTKPASYDGRPRIADSAAGRVHIEYRVYGRGEPLIVLVHGWSCDSNYWMAQIKPLAAKYTVVTVDLAGHGASGANRSDWTMAAFGSDVAAAVNALPKAGPVILVGHSMGGPVVIEAAHQLGARVLGVIGVDTFQQIGLPMATMVERKKQVAGFEKDFIGSTRAFVAASLFRKDADPLFMRRIADDMSQEPPEVGIGALRGFFNWNGAPAMSSLSLPIVAINSDLHGVTDAARIAKLVPKFRLVTIPGTDHFLMMEHPEKFNPELLRQIESLTAH